MAVKFVSKSLATERPGSLSGGSSGLDSERFANKLLFLQFPNFSIVCILISTTLFPAGRTSTLCQKLCYRFAAQCNYNAHCACELFVCGDSNARRVDFAKVNPVHLYWKSPSLGPQGELPVLWPYVSLKLASVGQSNRLAVVRFGGQNAEIDERTQSEVQTVSESRRSASMHV